MTHSGLKPSAWSKLAAVVGRLIVAVPPTHLPRQDERGRIAADESLSDSQRARLDSRQFGWVLSLMVFLAFPRVALGVRTFAFRDFGLFSYPVAHFARDSFWRGELPLWNPLNHCGLPFLAQWNTMALYPPTLIYLLLPLGWSLSFFCLLHLLWGGLGMYFLARRWTGHWFAGALAGVVFSFNGLSLNFLMWPSHLATFSWVPWLLWLVPEGWRQGGRVMMWAVAAATMQMLAGGPETIIATWLLLAVLAAIELWKGRRPRTSAQGADGSEPEENSGIVLRNVGMVALVALLCAAQLLPFLDLLAHSQRDSGFGAAAHDWAMPIWGWGNFLVPLFRTNPTPQGVFLQNGQYWTSSYYVGIGTIWLALIALRRLAHWRVRLLAMVCFVALVLAWGDTSLLFHALRACFPGLGFMRYPVKFVIFAVPLLPLLAAYGAAVLFSQGRLGRFEWASAATLLVLVALIVVVERNAPADVWSFTFRNALGRAGFLVAEVLLFSLLLRQTTRQPSARSWRFAGALVIVFYLDLLSHVPNQNPTVSPNLYSGEIAQLQFQSGSKPILGRSRAMVSPAARERLKGRWVADPAQNLTRNRLAGWSDLNLLESIPEVDGFFSLVPREAWRVTELPYSQPKQDFSPLLDFMGVYQISQDENVCAWNERATALPLVTIGQQPRFADDPASFRALGQPNLDLSQTVLLPLAASGVVTAASAPAAKTKSLVVGNQRITFDTESTTQAMAVISQTYFPGWKAYVDGKPAKIWRANYAFQTLEIPPGKHRVLLVYRDRAFVAGIAISGLALAGWFVLWLRMPAKRLARSP